MPYGLRTKFIVSLFLLSLTACGGDSSGNEDSKNKNSGTTTDTTAPLITLVGDNPMIVAHGASFNDPGATVTDNVDTGLSAIVTGTVDSLDVADYTLTYNVTDAAGNAAEAITRTVSVVDMTAPVISLIGDNATLVAQGETFTDLGVTVTDNVDTGLTAVVTGTIDTLTVGDYILTYSVSDTSGNSAKTLTRTVTVADMTAPEITLIGDDSITHPFGDNFVDPGSRVFDNVDIGLTATVTGNVNTTVAGDYLLTYEVSDSAGNVAVSSTRTVSVSPAIFKLAAGLYDTCAYTGDDRKLRCFGYNDGAHGNGLLEEIGESFGEAKQRFEVCKSSTEQVITFVVSDDPLSPCGDYYAPKIVEWFEQGNDTALGSDTYCPSKHDQIITTTKVEESENCNEGAYAFYWGEDSNDDSDLSTNEMGAALLPAILPNSELLAFDVADSFGCGIFADQTTRCWGSNNNGQLGKGAPGDVLTEGELGDALIPVDFGDGLYATEIHLADSSSACALLNNGRIKCWGNHNATSLGFATDTDIGLTAESMGNNLLPIDLGTNPDTLEPYKATTMAFNSRNGCAVLDNGGVKCWGANNYGGLGLGEGERYPEQVFGDDDGEMGDNLGFVLLGDFHAIAVATGYHFQCALSNDNRIKCWGQNIDGQLGISDTESRGNGHEDAYARSVYIANESVYDIKSLNTGNDGLTLCPTSLANKGFQLAYGQDDGAPSGIADNGILEDGEIITTELVCDTDELIAYVEQDLSYEGNSRIKMAYGLYGNDYAEMGNGLPTVDLGVNEEVIKLAANYYNACALVNIGKVKCWGYSKTGGADSAFNIGDAPERSVALADYIDFGTIDKVVDITMGGYQSCVIFESGGVKCWGYNEYGEMGQPAFESDYLGDGLPNPEMGVNLPYVDLR
ncbi:DUF5011 domain-containing protein [Thalassotalea psychrophila]|uniref:DUF5011 domain-containing protein n=1 Tax=Thalassotalea psychrophila TaxID=3065647 RepID=A0ABY9TQ92_9GAMM|nr:DUF5011 domain-containing protein [Colwelliaceae bacterium SQ149]